MFSVDFIITESDIPTDNLEISVEENENVINSRPPKNDCLRFLNFLIISLIITPISIIFWASTWDIIDIYAFPNNIYLTYGVPLLVSKVILLVCYGLQNHLQRLGNRLKLSAPKTGFFSFFNRYILLKTIYAYFISVGYVGQWRTYWDVYNQLTIDIDFYYSVSLSMLGFLLYRYFLGIRISELTTGLPFYLKLDKQYDEIFIQNITFKFQNVNLFYFRKIKIN